MWRFLKNVFSYIGYVFSLDWSQFAGTIIDVMILVWSILNRQPEPASTILFWFVLFNLVWQLFNVTGHFKFLVRENTNESLGYKLSKEDKLGEIVKVEKGLSSMDVPYTINNDLGILENAAVDTILIDKKIPINSLLSKGKRKRVRTYIIRYKEILLKFLNYKWYHVNHRRGLFTNDKKVCLSSEMFQNETGYCWKIEKGRYYDGVLTNTIFSQHIKGSPYEFNPPWSVDNYEIKSLEESGFSDHIGASTLLFTNDGYLIICRQSEKTGQYAGKYMPSGSGSLDFSDYRKGEDFRNMIIRGAERELFEETSLDNKKKRLAIDKIHFNSSVIHFYRDLERGGKPEFSCITRVNTSKSELFGLLTSNEKEIAQNGIYALKWNDFERWEKDFFAEASLSLKANYLAVRSLLEKQ